MELWIRSQDRERFAHIEDLRIVRGNHSFSIVNDLDETVSYVLGTYKTKKRCIEILDEIYILLHPRAVIKSDRILTENDVWEIKRVYENVFKDTNALVVNEDLEIHPLGFIEYEMPKE